MDITTLGQKHQYLWQRARLERVHKKDMHYT